MVSGYAVVDELAKAGVRIGYDEGIRVDELAGGGGV